MNEIRLALHADPRAVTPEINGLQGGFQLAHPAVGLLGMYATRPPQLPNRRAVLTIALLVKLCMELKIQEI